MSLDAFTQPVPPQLSAIRAKTKELGFNMPADLLVGSLLRTLVSGKPAGRFLELGTGLGLSLAYMVEGMGSKATIISLDSDLAQTDFAANLFVTDKRVTVLHTDGESWINHYTGPPFDLIFADTWPGKYNHLEETLALLANGGFYIIDDMLEQDNWPEGHAAKVFALLKSLSERSDLCVTTLDWSTGVVIACKL